MYNWTWPDCIYQASHAPFPISFAFALSAPFGVTQASHSALAFALAPQSQSLS